MFLKTILMILFSFRFAKADFEFASVIEQIIFSDHRHEINGINFLNGIENKNSHLDKDFINEIFSRVGTKISIQTISFNESQENVKERFFFNVIYVDSVENFLRIRQKLTAKIFNFKGFYLIIFMESKNTDLKIIFKELWDLYITNVIVLSNESRSEIISASNFVPFSEFGCNKTDPVKIAEFKNETFKIKPQLFFPDKFSNFHGCLLKVSTFESLAPSVLKEDFANGSYRLYGRDVDVMKTLSSEFYFKLEISYLKPYGAWGVLSPNGSATGAMGRAIRREADFVLGNIFLKHDRSKFMDFSYGYYLDQLVLMIPPGKLLTSFENLVRPFEIFVWILICATVLCGFIVIIFINFQSKFIRDFVFGRDIRVPFMNILIAMFGLSQHKLPTKNFSRTLLMIFILFCLVIR
jgi:hypothetical protein